MKILIILSVLFFAGCSTLPTHMPADYRHEVVIIVHEDLEALRKSDLFYRPLRGKQYFQDGKCYVHFSAGDYEALSHEIAHCFYGAFHD